ncbi:hypothetical protein CXB51_008996 [Gossypium anomalum]|uniref:ATP synthase F1 complex delta/epsilon subunit N-terminal domain-containing protein n=1 Tax=Gossypium anomalum TaxID=47600 RepID=A0A8J5YTJ0_9ROSI|nr:hypothetical protein CXB51_008996 [Gossypium anomalum]
MFSHIVPPIFDGGNYQACGQIGVLPNHSPIATAVDIGILRIHLNDQWLTMALMVRMTVYLDAMNLWEEDKDVPSLPANPMMNQLKTHKEKKTRKSKAKACLFSTVSSKMFTRIMNLGSAKKIWNYLKKEYQGNERTKNMQVLNLTREFEMMKMNETETNKDYFDKLGGIVNKSQEKKNPLL